MVGSRSPQFSRDELCGIRKWLTSERALNPEILRSQSSFDVRMPVRRANDVLHYAKLLDPDCSALPGLSQEGVVRAIRSGYRDLRVSPWKNILSSENSEDLLIELDLRDAPALNPFGTFNPQVVKGILQKFESEVASGFPGLRSYWMGEADFQGYMLEGIQQAGILNLVLMLFLILALRFLYGTWRSGLIFTAILAVCGTIVFGAMALFGAPLDVLTNTLFLMLAGAGLENFVFLCNQQLLEGSRWKRSFRTLILPGFFTSLTTFVGFASLAMTDVHVIARFGLWAAHECSAAGSLVAYAEFAELIPRTLLESFLMSLGLVGAIAVLGIPANMMTCMFASVLVGLTGDNAIQFLLGASRRGGLEQGIELRGVASIQCSLLMASAALIFLGSYFVHPRVFGVLLSAGLIASLVGDVWILKGLIRNRQ